MNASGLVRAYDKVLYGLHCLGSYAVLAVMVWMCADIGLRALINQPVAGTFEMVGLSLPVIIFLQIPYILRQRMHLRAPSIDKWVGPRVQARLVVANHLLGALVFAVAAYAMWFPMTSAWLTNEYMGEGDIHIPSWPVWVIIFLSCVLMVAEYLIQLVEALQGQPQADREVPM